MPKDSPLAGKKAVFFDLDGVIYTGNILVPGAREAVLNLSKLGINVKFLTNNASKTPLEVSQKLKNMGIATGLDQIITSAEVGATALAKLIPTESEVLVVGATALASALKSRGLRPVWARELESKKPTAVIQGLDVRVCWRDLAGAVRVIRDGGVWVACNTDLTLPSEYGPLPGNGSLVEVVRRCAGQDPKLVAGKPAPLMFHAALRALGLDPKSVLMIGDRLETDIYGAQNAGIEAACVLTGATTPSVLEAAKTRPNWVLKNLRELF